MASKIDPSAIAARFPGPVTLTPSRRKWLVILAGCLVFAIGGHFMVQEGADGGWFVLLSFGLGSLIAVVPLVPGSGRLTLDRDGFTTVSMFRSTRTRWRDTSRFETATLPPASHKMVVFDDASRSGKLASVNVGLTGRNSALPDTYGLSTEDLASVMESWRERALNSPDA